MAPRSDMSSRPGAVDPLAELARLVGQEDPFRNVFKPAAPPAPAGMNEHEEVAPQEALWPAAHPETDGAPHELGLRPLAHDEHDWAETEVPVAAHSEAPRDPGEDHYAEIGAPAPAYDEPDQIYDAPAPAPQHWSEPQASRPDEALADDSATGPRTPRRPLVVLFAVLALTGGGLAATFLARSGTSIAATGSRGAPTIMAASTPVKIQQVDTSTATNAEDAESALLSRNGEANGGPTKVVNSQEQPLDLAQLPKATGTPDGVPDALPTNSQSPFPEPRRVKTFVVRADGSMISTSAANALTPQGLTGLPQMAALPPEAIAQEQQPGAPQAATPRPVTPRSGSHAVTTPKAPAATIGDLSGDATDTVAAKPKQPAAPGPKASAKAKPIEVADASASDATAAPQNTGGFALQLAASPSEHDAREAFVRLQKKYSELGSYKPMVKKAENTDKSIYRLRVGSMSQDQAKTLCAQLQASGGSCFVVHN